MPCRYLYLRTHVPLSPTSPSSTDEFWDWDYEITVKTHTHTLSLSLSHTHTTVWHTVLDNRDHLPGKHQRVLTKKKVREGLGKWGDQPLGQVYNTGSEQLADWSIFRPWLVHILTLIETNLVIKHQLVFLNTSLTLFTLQACVYTYSTCVLHLY